MALNDSLAWSSVSARHRAAFLGETAERKFVPNGTKLYRFVTRGDGLVNEGGLISPWWFPLECFGEFDRGLEGVLDFARTVGVSSTEYVRLIAAVTEQWNTGMNAIRKAELMQPVYAFWGQCANQPRKKGSTVNLPGRAYQMYIPNLTTDHLKEIEVVSAP